MTPEQKQKKILVVDDDNDILDIMREALTFEGYEVNSLDKTDNIFPDIIQYQPDIVILDYLLSGVNGGELCHQIKINRHTANIPVILMSAHPRVLQSLGDYGCNLFIPKPFELAALISGIQKLTSATPIQKQ